MKKAIIKKSNNVHAWSNKFIGQEVQAIETNEPGYEGGFKVDFSKNPHLNVNPSFVSGILMKEDCDIV